MTDGSSPRMRQAVKFLNSHRGFANTGDILAGTADEVRFFTVEKAVVKRIYAYVNTADVGNAITLHVALAATLDQAVSSAATIDSFNIPVTQNVKGSATFINLSPTSGDMEAGEEMVVRLLQGGPASYEIHGIIETGFEIPENQPGGRITKEV